MLQLTRVQGLDGQGAGRHCNVAACPGILCSRLWLPIKIYCEYRVILIGIIIIILCIRFQSRD
jgi:hypothetical protein